MPAITETDNKFINSLIQDCITYRLSENEAMEYIRIKFRGISLSSLRHRKARVLSDQTTQIWLNDYTRIGFVANHRQQIEHIQKIQDDSMRQLFVEINRHVRNEYVILQIKKDIRENTELLAQLNLGTPIVSAIKVRLEEKQKEEDGTGESTKALQIRQ